MEWGGYVRTFGQAQGVLQRLVLSENEQRMPRAAGTHSDPVFANLAAEETLHIRRISSFDRMMRSYAPLYRQLAAAMYVECMTIEHAARTIGLSVKVAEGCMGMIKRQAEIDWAHTALMDTRSNPQTKTVARAG